MLFYSEYRFIDLKVMSVFFTKLHGALRKHNITNLGVSFPEYVSTHDCGLRIYLISSQNTLAATNNAMDITKDLLNGNIEKLREGNVPDQCEWKIYKRDRSIERYVGKKAEHRISSVPHSQKIAVLDKYRKHYSETAQHEGLFIGNGDSSKCVILRIREMDGSPPENTIYNSYGLSGMSNHKNERGELIQKDATAVPVF